MKIQAGKVFLIELHLPQFKQLLERVSRRLPFYNLETLLIGIPEQFKMSIYTKNIIQINSTVLSNIHVQQISGKQVQNVTPFWNILKICKQGTKCDLRYIPKELNKQTESILPSADTPHASCSNLGRLPRLGDHCDKQSSSFSFPSENKMMEQPRRADNLFPILERSFASQGDMHTIFQALSQSSKEVVCRS